MSVRSRIGMNTINPVDLYARGLGLDFHGHNYAHQKHGDADADCGGYAHDLKPFWLVKLVAIWCGLAADVFTAILVVITAIRFEAVGACLDLAAWCAAIRSEVPADTFEDAAVLLNSRVFVVHRMPFLCAGGAKE